LLKLKGELQRSLTKGSAIGSSTERSIAEIINLVRVDEFPLLEKANIFHLYRDWADGKNIADSAKEIADECRRFREGERGRNYGSVMSHFKADLLAQLRRDYRQSQRYEGLSTFIDMTLGSPKNLLMLLKNIFDWAVFNGERPFEAKPISRSAQAAGLNKTVDWFYENTRIPGEEGILVQSAIDRFGNFLRSFRFSDKPSECSCIAFSVYLAETHEDTKRILDLAVQWSLLLAVGSQKDRNSSRVDAKYQLNPMLSPRWDLPIYRRGVLALQPEEVDALFNPSPPIDGVQRLDERVKRLNAPQFGRAEGEDLGQGKLFDIHG
jgi:hypothetical protein